MTRQSSGGSLATGLNTDRTPGQARETHSKRVIRARCRSAGQCGSGLGVQLC